MLHSQCLRPVLQHVRELALRQPQPRIQGDVLDALPFPRPIHGPLQPKGAKNRLVPAGMGFFQTLPRATIRHRHLLAHVSVSLARQELPQGLMPDLERPLPNPSLHLMNGAPLGSRFLYKAKQPPCRVDHFAELAFRAGLCHPHGSASVFRGKHRLGNPMFSLRRPFVSLSESHNSHPHKAFR